MIKPEQYEFLELFDQEKEFDEPTGKGAWMLTTPEGYTFTFSLISQEKKAFLKLINPEYADPLFDVEVTNIEKITIETIKEAKLLRFYKKVEQVFDGSHWVDATKPEPSFEIMVRPHVSFTYDFESLLC